MVFLYLCLKGLKYLCLERLGYDVVIVLGFIMEKVYFGYFGA